MGNNTNNTQLLVRQEIWQAELEETLHEYLTGCPFVREIDFPDGNALTMPSIGTPVVRDYANDEDTFIIDSIDTGEITITLKRPIVAVNSVSQVLEEDSFYASELKSAIPTEQAQAIMERYESDVFALANHQALGTGNANLINGFAHRRIGTGTNETMAIADFSKARLSLTKAKVPGNNLVAFVDPTVAYALETTTNITNISNNPMWQGIVETGMSNNFRFIRNVYGFDVYESNLLADANETIGGLTTTAGKANIFMSLARPGLLPFVVAWKRRPTMKVDTVFMQDDKLVVKTTARYGMGLVRDENFVVIITDTDQAN